MFKAASVSIEKLAGVSEIKFVKNKEEAGDKTCGAATAGAEFYIPLGELVDFEKETARLNKERDKIMSEIKRGENMLSNAGFVNKAPVSLIEKEKEKAT